MWKETSESSGVKAKKWPLNALLDALDALKFISDCIFKLKTNCTLGGVVCYNNFAKLPKEHPKFHSLWPWPSRRKLLGSSILSLYDGRASWRPCLPEANTRAAFRFKFFPQSCPFPPLTLPQKSLHPNLYSEHSDSVTWTWESFNSGTKGQEIYF